VVKERFCVDVSLVVSDCSDYSLDLKISWAPVHELAHVLSMPLDLCLAFPGGIFNWMALPLDQIFKVLFSPGLFTDSLV
jgi:hypothetical protein